RPQSGPLRFNPQPSYSPGNFRGPSRSSYSNPRQFTPSNPRGPRPPRDPNAFCTFCKLNGHSYEQCYSKLRVQNNYSRPPVPPTKEHHTNTIKAYKSSTTNYSDHWIYDTACTEHMTWNPDHFQ